MQPEAIFCEARMKLYLAKKILPLSRGQRSDQGLPSVGAASDVDT